MEKIPKNFTVSLSSLPQRGIWPFTRVTVHWGKENNPTFQGPLDTSSELILIPRENSKKHHDPSAKVGACGGQVLAEV